MGEPHVAIVILNWNGWRDTLECLGSLTQQDYPNASIIVIDNASTDGSPEYIRDWPLSSGRNHVGRNFVIPERDWASDRPLALQAHDFVFLQAATNGGFAAGNNKGIRLALAAGAQYVWLLNNDTAVAPAALSALVRCAELDVTVGMCGSLLVYYDSRDRIQACGGVRFDYWRGTGTELGQGLNPQQTEVARVLDQPLTYISGASLLARAGMIAEIGMLEERYFLYFEEIDWATRASSWRLSVALDSIVYHKEGASIGTSTRGRASPLAQYYRNRNLLLFYGRFHRCKIPIAIARVLRELVRQIRLDDRHLARVTWRALIHGLRYSEGPVDQALLR